MLAITGCGTAPPSPAPLDAPIETPPSPPAAMAASSEPVERPPEPPPLAAPPPPASAALTPPAPERRPARACAFATIGFDHRALPTNTSPEAFDQWVIGQADHIRQAAPPGSSPRLLVQPGSGTVNVLFDGDTRKVVLARCEATVKAYLPTAPNLPLISAGSATHVQTPCRPCP